MREKKKTKEELLITFYLPSPCWRYSVSSHWLNLGGYRPTYAFEKSSHHPHPSAGIAFAPALWIGKHQTLSAARRAKVCFC